MNPRRWIFISPHLDDAILSCGGFIHYLRSLGNIVEIWTICAGDPPEGDLSPFALKQQNDFVSAVDYCERRRKEDIDASNYLGARFRHFAFQDCIYRRSINGQWLYASEESIFGEIRSDDEEMINDIAVFLDAIIKPQDTVVSPLSIGNHVDHQLTRSALERLNIPLSYYADFPYVLRDNEEILKLEKFTTEEKFKLSPEDINKWMESIEFYSSQIKNVFDSLENMRDSIGKFTQIQDNFVIFHHFPIS